MTVRCQRMPAARCPACTTLQFDVVEGDPCECCSETLLHRHSINEQQADR